MNGSINLRQLMTIQRLFFVTKIRSATLATKIIKKIKDLFLRKLASIWLSISSSIQDLPFVFAQMNATNCIGGQKNKIFILGIRNPLCRERGWCVSAQAIGDRL